MITSEMRQSMKEFAVDIRIGCITALESIGIGHVGGSFSICDLMAVLYGGVMNVDPKNPRWEQRDRFIMSKGHAGPAMYAALANRGFFDIDMLTTLNKPGTNLPSHTDRSKTPGVDMTTGSLGQGFSSGLGIALACKLKGLNNRTFILLGDGECQEGQVWECVMFAPAKKLSNVITFIDFNNRQIDGFIDEVIPLGNISKKFAEFGWNALDVADGNDIDQICDALEKVLATEGPSVIVLHTLKGKGCAFAEKLENNHNCPVSHEQAQETLKDLYALKAGMKEGRVKK